MGVCVKRNPLLYACILPNKYGISMNVEASMRIVCIYAKNSRFCAQAVVVIGDGGWVFAAYSRFISQELDSPSPAKCNYCLKLMQRVVLNAVKERTFLSTHCRTHILLYSRKWNSLNEYSNLIGCWITLGVYIMLA